MMRNILLLLVLAAGLSVSCGSTEQQQTDANRADTNQGTANSAARVDEVPVPPQSSATNRAVVEVDKDSITGTPPPGAKPYEREAPEDSTYTSSLGNTALEVRTFKKHPQILRVEKTIDGTTQTVKVFLKNGKTIDVDAEKLPNIATASSAMILEAAGMKAAKTAAPSGPKKVEN